MLRTTDFTDIIQQVAPMGLLFDYIIPIALII